MDQKTSASNQSGHPLVARQKSDSAKLKKGGKVQRKKPNPPDNNPRQTMKGGKKLERKAYKKK